ncbi:MAG: HIT family protein [Patescibacteria group bacterium]
MCIFCKIINHEIPCYKVYEDDKVLAFLDIKPVNPGHTLVIPKKHYQNLEEISEDDLAYLMITVKKVGKLLKDKLNVVGYNVHENNDLVAGQAVPHIHFHLIPRVEGDGLEHWPGGAYKDGEAEEVLKKLKS